MKLPAEVLIEDEALRDGLQIEKRIFSVDEKLRLIDQLVVAGLRRIQVGSFVHPKRVPQMANTDELFAALKPVDEVTYTALILNRTGLDRALAAGVRHLSISVSASETHSRKNANKSVSEALTDITATIERALSEGVAVRAGIQSALGCGYEGAISLSRVVDIAALFSRIGAHEINIADSAGLGNPKQVYETVEGGPRRHSPRNQDFRCTSTIRAASDLPTFSPGLQAGVTIFDAAAGGVGGCPFIPGASGNIASEDAVLYAQRDGVKSGVDWRKLCAVDDRTRDQARPQTAEPDRPSHARLRRRRARAVAETVEPSLRA